VGLEEQRTVVGQHGLVAHEHDAAFFVVLAKAFACAESRDTGTKDKVVSANHFKVR